ncbi:papain-like cysteine protease family protein [Marinobacterium iners]|uniref:Peptidase_C39 like family protein n=1 Tax=Marinobacterium iners DSM 11526 TaxID=1122198 RepID=A0A1H4E5V0_9GAMM|nr:papain-like cysteine protease family protein [Marinobacterium iners]SEA80415.1 Peptidase_C39 like family protein [Marinobacterium iners DSM 11526]
MNTLFKLIFVIFLSVVSLMASAIERQQAQNWCWAASVQDVMAQAGFYQTQPQIAARLDGWPRDRPAYTQELVLLLRSYGFRAWQAGRPGSPQELYGSLSSGWKLIAFVRPSNGAVGHFIVLQGIDPISRGIIVSDPWTGQTYVNSLQQLYQGWRWGDSVVVGTPG